MRTHAGTAGSGAPGAAPDASRTAETSPDHERAAPAAGRDATERRATPWPGAPLDVRSIALTGLFVLAVLYTAYLARSFLLPVVSAVLLTLFFAPTVRRLSRLRIAPSVSALVIVFGLLGLLAYGGYSLTGPAGAWMARAPESLNRLETKLRSLRRPVENVTRTAERVGALAAVSPADRNTVKVEVMGPSILGAVFGGTQQVVSAGLVMLALLFFMLASGDLFLSKIVRFLPSLTDKKRAVQIARETEDHISRYLVVTTAINVAFGLLIGVVVHWLGMPNAALWGVLAAATNFVPYLGALVMTAVLALAALLQFEETGRALSVPAVFFVLNTIEGNFVTPALLGRRLLLNPVVVFLGVLFWGWLWGVIGTVLAVPILSAVKIVCDHVDGLAPIAELLGP